MEITKQKTAKEMENGRDGFNMSQQNPDSCLLIETYRIRH